MAVVVMTASLTFLSRVYIVPTDLGIYLTALIMIILTQVLLWSIARYTTDIEIWRCLGFCAVVGAASAMGFALAGASGNGWWGVLGCGAFAGYLIGGFIYDFDLWQRIVVAICGPILAAIAFFGGYALKGLIYSGLS